MVERTPIWAVLPVKSFRTAKARMTPLLGSTERQQLARLMFEDVLTAALQCDGLAGVMVVTADEEVAELASTRRAIVHKETAEAGTNAAVRLAVEALGQSPGSGMIVLPCDVPQVSPAFIGTVVRSCAAAGSLVLVPATRDGGTNLLASSPAGLIETGFGPGSFARHQANAARAGVTAQVSAGGGLHVDLDRPEDLKGFLALGTATLTHCWLVRSGIASRLEHSRAAPPLECRPLAAAQG